MVLLAAVVALTVVSDARTPVPPLKIDVVAAPTVTRTLLDAAVEEVDAIWNSAGVTFEWRRARTRAMTDASLTVSMEDAAPPVARGSALGWIRFTGRVPDTTIHLSRANAIELLLRFESIREKPMVFQERMLGRALGRALAHELGHYLLRSTAHSPGGLMRAVRPSPQFFSVERIGFDISTEEREAVRALLACSG